MYAPPSARLMMLLFAALPLACAEPLGPSDVAGTYALHRVAGDSLPAVLYTTEYVTVRIFADTLRFTPDGRGTVMTVRESQPLIGGPPTGPERLEWGFGFRIVEGRIEVGFDCPINANCVPPPHLVARRTPDGLRADFAGGSRVPLIYARLGSVP